MRLRYFTGRNKFSAAFAKDVLDKELMLQTKENAAVKFALPQKVSPIDVMATLKMYTGILNPTLQMTT